MRYFNLLLAFVVGLVGAFDTVCTLVYHDGMIERERNLLSEMLMRSEGVMGFVIYKAALTMLVVLVLLALAYTRFWIIIPPVAAFQVCLLWFLLFADDSSREYNYTSSPAQDVLAFYATEGRNMALPEYWPAERRDCPQARDRHPLTHRFPSRESASMHEFCQPGNTLTGSS